MDNFFRYNYEVFELFINPREGEKKIGEKIQWVKDLNDLAASSAKFVLIGIPEDIGVRANGGIGGASSAWNSFLRAFLNMQSNPFLDGEELLLLGHFDIGGPFEETIAGLRTKTTKIDELVYPIIEQIVSAGKIPIVIGGGHNNAYGIIKGTSTARKNKIDVINIDAHADLRAMEGRHSGNPFRYALAEGYLNQYRIFGLKQNYVNPELLTLFEENSNLKALYFEDLLLSNQSVKQNWFEFINPLSPDCGLELDLDSIENVLSSACSPSGFQLNEIRTLLLSGGKAYSYLHICEGATELGTGQTDSTTGKTIAFLVSDFVRGLRPHISEQL